MLNSEEHQGGQYCRVVNKGGNERNVVRLPRILPEKIISKGWF